MVVVASSFLEGTFLTLKNEKKRFFVSVSARHAKSMALDLSRHFLSLWRWKGRPGLGLALATAAQSLLLPLFFLTFTRMIPRIQQKTTTTRATLFPFSARCVYTRLRYMYMAERWQARDLHSGARSRCERTPVIPTPDSQCVFFLLLLL